MKINLTPAAPSNAAIAADAARTYLEFAIEPDKVPVKWCFGATYVEADSQLLYPGIARVWSGSTAQQAFSFSPGTGAISVTDLP